MRDGVAASDFLPAAPRAGSCPPGTDSTKHVQDMSWLCESRFSVAVPLDREFLEVYAPGPSQTLGTCWSPTGTLSEHLP